MIRSAASKALGLGRATALPVVLAVMLVVVFGTTPASAHGGYKGLLHLGHSKSATNTTTLVGNILDTAKAALVVQNTGGGSALGLQVNAGKAPLTVNADAGKATNLNADKVDGKNATQIGVNGLQQVYATSARNSDSPKPATATCPSGKFVVGTGYFIGGGTSGTGNNQQTDVVVNQVFIDEASSSSQSVVVIAYEEATTSADWTVTALAICANAP